MLSDWLERLLTTCPAHLRDMGCLREMLGIRRRRRSFRAAWEHHCVRSRELVLAAAARCRQRRRAVVLGSGWLNDVPLDELAGTFQEVVLVDLFHPFAVRWRARPANVRLVAGDVTGTLEQVWLAGAERTPVLPPSRPTVFAEGDDLDLTVSLNILSQLPVMPEQYLLRRRSHSAETITAYCRDVIRAHLRCLESLPGVVALIADTEVRTVIQTGEEISREGTLFGVELPYRGQEWEWTLVPRRRSWPHHAEVLRVVGVTDIKHCAPR